MKICSPCLLPRVLEACPRAGDVVQLVELSASIHETPYKLGGAQVYNFSSQSIKAGVSEAQGHFQSYREFRTLSQTKTIQSVMKG